MKNKTINKNKTLILYVAFALIIILAALVRLFPLENAHWWDETVYLQNAEVISGTVSGEESYHELGFRPPLLSILFAFGFLFKQHVFTASVIITILTLLAPIFTFLIGKELYNTNTGFIAGSLMAFIPFIVKNSGYLMTDMPAVSFICIGVYFMVKRCAPEAKESRFYFLSGLFFSFAVLTRFTSLILLFVIPIYFLLKKINWLKLFPIGVGFATGLIPYLIWAKISLGGFLRPFIVAQWMVTGENTSKFFYFTSFIEAFSPIVLCGLVIWTIALISTMIFKNSSRFEDSDSARNFYNRNLKRYFGEIDVFFVLWVLIFLAYMTFMVAHKELRYILPIVLPVVMIASRGIAFFIGKRSGLSRITRFILLILIFTLAIFSFIPSFTDLSKPWINIHKTDEMKVSDFIVDNYPENTTIYTNQNYPVFAYYTGYNVVKLEEQDRTFYEVFPENTPKPGLLIIYKGLKHPSSIWVESNSRFRFGKSFGDIMIFEYNPEKQFSDVPYDAPPQHYAPRPHGYQQWQTKNET